VNLYETTFIVDAQLQDEGWESVIDKYSGIIKQNGSIKQIDRWGVRRLAYEINKQTHGYYVHVIHESAPSVPSELERQFHLDETCMRHLTVLADNPKYIEEMNKAKARQAAAEEASAQPADATPAGSKDEDRKPAGDSEPDANPKAEVKAEVKAEDKAADNAEEQGDVKAVETEKKSDTESGDKEENS